MSKKNEKSPRESTLAALLREKPKRGRPPRAVSRQNVYVALTDYEKEMMDALAESLPANFARADIPDLAITVLTSRLEALRQAVSGRNREIPEGVTDLESLYLLWDLSLPPKQAPAQRKWTSIRLSPQPSIELGRIHGTLNAVFNANRSDTFSLALALFGQFVTDVLPTFEQPEELSLEEMRIAISEYFMSSS